MEETNLTETAVAPLYVRGPFNVFDRVREMRSKALRFKASGFNLDLQYINTQIIAMSCPSEGFGAMTTNHTDEVLRFFNYKHKGHYAFFNLVGEANKNLFKTQKLGAVNQSFAFASKGVPKLTLIQAFCTAVNQWLERNPKNVAVVMCDNGCERTGLMVSCLLMFRMPGAYGTAKEAIQYFTDRRMPQGMEAIPGPSQRRYVGYFSQRFSAEPKELKLSKVVVPTAPLKMSKIRLEIFVLLPGSDKGHATHLEKIWTSRGRHLGDVHSGESYCAFLFPGTLALTGDIRLVFSGQRHRGTPFYRLFHLDFNCGFIDHSPTVWDLGCLDGVSSIVPNLPVDFHVQTLFFNTAFLECDVLRSQKPARFYCWDCDHCWLSEEGSKEVHSVVRAIGAGGEIEPLISGPRHRYHALIHDDCAICFQRRAGLIVSMSIFREVDNDVMEDTARRDKAITKQGRFAAGVKEEPMLSNAGRLTEKVETEPKAFDDSDVDKILQWRKEKDAILREKEIAMFKPTGIKVEKEKAKPMFGYPSVYCPEKGEFYCSWCVKHELSKELRRHLFAIPIIPSSSLRYSGSARQVC